jgi:hypothetical protein
VRKLVAGNALRLLGAGLAFGLPTALALDRIMSGVLLIATLAEKTM